jgi:hypothetical protein
MHFGLTACLALLCVAQVVGEWYAGVVHRRGRFAWLGQHGHRVWVRTCSMCVLLRVRAPYHLFYGA